MSTITAPLTSFALAALVPDIVRSCVVLQPSPPPDPGEEPPAPVTGNDIYTPIAPGVTYANLPVAPTIVDTSPDQMIGCIVTVADNPQGRLNALFPSAISGDGVIDRATNDIWVYDSATWNNVGPTPGPTITATVVIPPWNETLLAVARTRTKLNVNALAYALELLTEPDPIVTTTALLARSAPAYVAVPSVDIALLSYVPVVPVIIGVPSSNFVSETYAPSVYAGASISPSSIPVLIAGLPPEAVGKPKLKVLAASADFVLAALAPSVSTGGSIPVPTGQTTITAYAPQVGPYTYEVFLAGGTWDWSSAGEPSTVDVLLVGGGGGGGAWRGGGGGAGGVRVAANVSVTGNVTVTIGSGGSGNTGGSTPVAAQAGGSSSFGSESVGGGGFGGLGQNSGNAGGNGGSGGGAGGAGTDGSQAPGTGTSGQGNNGGDSFDSGTATFRAGGGGGGKGAAGQNASSLAGGNGGDGVTLASLGFEDAISFGAPSSIGGGGGGSSNSGSSGSGGTGGGGAGNASGNATNGTANTGGGGGGAGGGFNSVNQGGAGGSGLVIVRWV